MDKPTAEQVSWVFEKINENAGCSFRKLIYDRMGFSVEDYSKLHSSGGQVITNAMVDSIDTDKLQSRIKFLVEQAGRCWHDNNYWDYACDDFTRCSKCMKPSPEATNPSPDDLNAIVELAGELNVCLEIDIDADSRTLCSAHLGQMKRKADGQSLDWLAPAHTLLIALSDAAGWKEE